MQKSFGGVLRKEKEMSKVFLEINGAGLLLRTP